MLMCPVEDIGNILTFHHITAPAGGFSDHLGLAIASDEVPRLAVVEHVNELTVGSDVALCRARDSSAFVYGRVSSGKLTERHDMWDDGLSFPCVTLWDA